MSQTPSGSSFVWLTPLKCRLILVGVLSLGFVLHFIYLNYNCPLDLSGDEAHYWDWSRQLDWSYYSKGPLVAYVIRLGCLLWGDNELGVRFPALVLAVLTCLCTYWLTCRVYGSERTGLGAVLLCHIVPMFVAGSLLMTIDPPYYFFWALATCLIHCAAVGEKRWAWLAAGVAIGLSFLAKYAALIWLISLLIFLIVARDQRKWLRTIWPWMTISVALIFTLPVVIWNAQHDWVTFGHVSRTTTENQSGFDPIAILGNLLLMAGSQIGILNPVVAGLMIGGIILVYKRSKALEPHSSELSGHRFLLSFSLPFWGLVAGVTLFKEIEPNWPAAAYFTLVPLSTWFVKQTWPASRAWLISAVVIGIVLMPILHYSSWLYPHIPFKPRQWDPATRLMGWQDIGQEVSLVIRQSDLHQPFILCDKYQLAGLMAFYVQGQPKTYCIGSYWSDPKRRDRLSQYDMWPDRSLEQTSLLGRDAVYVGQEAPELEQVFDRVIKLPNVPVVRRRITLREQKMYLCYNFHGIRRPTDGLTKR
jgi:undecaprenyl-diphosphatase